MAETLGITADLEDSVSPPRDNGEIVFESPWQQRLFGLTMALCRSDACDWPRFRRRLIARIAEADERPYWESWAVALEDALEESGTLARADLDARHQALLTRPPGHDHH